MNFGDNFFNHKAFKLLNNLWINILSFLLTVHHKKV